MRLLPIIRTLHPISLSEYKVNDTAGPSRSPEQERRIGTEHPLPHHSRPIEEPRIIGPSIRSHIPPPYPPPSCQKRLRYLNSSPTPDPPSSSSSPRRKEKKNSHSPQHTATATAGSATDHPRSARHPSPSFVTAKKRSVRESTAVPYRSVVLIPADCPHPHPRPSPFFELRDSSSALGGQIHQNSPSCTHFSPSVAFRSRNSSSAPLNHPCSSHHRRSDPLTLVCNLLPDVLSHRPGSRLSPGRGLAQPYASKILRAVELRAFHNAL